MPNGKCKDSPEAVPNKAYVISLPEDVAKREVLISVLTDLGLHVEHVEGVRNEQVCRHAERPNSAMPTQAPLLMLVLIVVPADQEIVYRADLTFKAQGKEAMLPRWS